MSEEKRGDDVLAATLLQLCRLERRRAAWSVQKRREGRGGGEGRRDGGLGGPDRTGQDRTTGEDRGGAGGAPPREVWALVCCCRLGRLGPILLGLDDHGFFY